MLDQKDFRESFPEAVKGFARQLWEVAGRSPSQAERAAHAVRGHDGMGTAECLRGAASSSICAGACERAADEPRL